MDISMSRHVSIVLILRQRRYNLWIIIACKLVAACFNKHNLAAKPYIIKVFIITDKPACACFNSFYLAAKPI